VFEDGSVIPGRRANVNVGDKVYMKTGTGVQEFDVVLATETHLCLQKPGTPILATYSNWTLNQKMSTVAPAAVSAEEIPVKGKKSKKDTEPEA
jgi:hypothetical protein